MIYVLGAAIISAIGVIALLSVKLTGALSGERAAVTLALESGKTQLASERIVIALTDERDRAMALRAACELRASNAERAAAASASTIARLMKEEGEHVIESIRSAATPDAARALLRDLMSTPLPGLPSPSADASAGPTADVDRHTDAGVSPAIVAGS